MAEPRIVWNEAAAKHSAIAHYREWFERLEHDALAAAEEGDGDGADDCVRAATIAWHALAREQIPNGEQERYPGIWTEDPDRSPPEAGR